MGLVTRFQLFIQSLSVFLCCILWLSRQLSGFLQVCYSCFFFLLPVNECAFKSVVKKIGSCTKNMSGFMSSELLHIDTCFRDKRVGSDLSPFLVCTLVYEMFLTKVMIGSVLIVLRSVHRVCATCAGKKKSHIFRYMLLSQSLLFLFFFVTA